MNGTNKNDQDREKIERQLRLINNLATRLPWVAVAGAVIITLFSIVYVYFTKT